MKLPAEQLRQQLAQTLLPIYIVHGDEPLLIQECCDAIRHIAKQQGYKKRQLLTVTPQFAWTELLAQINSFDLFSEKTMIELRLPTGKPGKTGGNVLKTIAEQWPNDKLLLLVCGKLDSATQKSKWLQALNKHGATVQVWPIGHQQLPRWLTQRLATYGLQTSTSGINLLADSCEGNLLAGAQTLEKLALLYDKGNLSTEQIIAAISDCSRYSIFDAVDAWLQSARHRYTKMIQHLHAEGSELTLLLWALARECRALAKIAYDCEQGCSMTVALQQHGVWAKRKPLLQQHLQQHDTRYYHGCLQQAGRIDQAIKGIQPGDAWQLLIDFGLNKC